MADVMTEAPDARALLLAALRLHLEWGADEALLEAPLDRTVPRLAAPAPDTVLAQSLTPAANASMAAISARPASSRDITSS